MRATAVAGLAVILFGVIGAFAWAATAPIASAVVSPGLVRVDTNRKQIQHLEGGVIKQILVRDGDVVAQGDPLVLLDETRASVSFGVLRAALDLARAQEARLIAVRDGAGEIRFPPDLLSRQSETEIAELIATQRNLFETRRTLRDGQIAILDNQIGQLNEQIEGLRAQLASKQRQIELIHEETSGLQQLYERGFTERPRLLALQREGERLEGEIGEHVAEIARIETAISERRLQKLQLEEQLREAAVAELKDVQAQILEFTERLSAADDVLQRVEITAPVDGEIVGLSVHTEGGVVRPGETILEIVPLKDRLIVEARIAPQDIDEVSVGAPARIRFSAFKQRTTPEVTGEVVSVSADVLTDDRTGEGYYVARIAADAEEVARLEERELQPGMPADIMITTGSRTALGYLLQPLTDAFRVAWRES
ncbi:MAG: HlyD family type I secretion periplasmic adaptor subunit [Parvularculaceae bacterium]